MPLTGCRRYREDIDYNRPVEYSWTEPEIAGEFTLFQGVDWDSAISQSVRPVLIDQSLVKNQSVLDLFSGPGVIAVICGYEDAKSVLSLAESEVAAACATYNVAAHDQDAIVTVRRIDWLASPVIPQSDHFDVIIATLATDGEPSKNGNDRRIEILLECIAGNLELSGRAIVVCQNEKVAEKLKAACEQAGHKLAPIGPEPSLRPIFEVTR